MAKKKQTPSGIPGEPQRTKHLSDEACKAAAAKISLERRSYEVDFVRYAQANFQAGYPGSFIPIWPADYDLCVEKINRLYHPEEATIIIENLTA
jgi:hypothetical protein